MFEGLVRQLLLGYLGRYIKDIQKDQLKITVWNEEVLLENVELILEAFEYLQLPIALKQGRVGKLSIKIPWKKLGRDPIIIMLEDVFVCASQRNDQEWSSDVVEKREFAGKKAKLAAAELAKLSKRVFDNPAGNPFMSYIAAKILDSIQVSIRNFHILYSDTQTESVQVVLGLRFSSLTITKQNPFGPSVGRVRGGQVNKLVEVEALEIYCDMYEGNMDFLSVDEKGGFENWRQSRMQSDKFGYLLKPVHVSVTLLVNRSGELHDDLPQYSISAELTDVAVTLNEFQLQQILILLDYLQTSQLRERYGRYRPSSSSLWRKPPGWQKLWWHYVQKSILSDVRKKLWKTSWRFLGERMKMRRRYINFYKIKLDFLRREQSIDESILLGLEEVEKKSDIDDILSYRSAAEGEMQETCSELTVSMGADSASGFEKEQSVSEKDQNDDPTSNKSRGWLNWLSRGMLGAGGTEDSSQFSGVVSDEVVKDIHEATKFHPLSSSPRNISATGKICTCSIRVNARKISATLQHINGSSSQVITELDILGLIVECKSWKESTTMIASVVSGRVVYPLTGKEILTMKGVCSQSDAPQVKPSYGARLELSQDHDVALSLKVTLQPLEAAFDGDFFLAVSKFFSGSRSFKLQHERVLSSLNGLETETRLAAKAEYLLSSRNKVNWDLDIKDLTLNFPGRLVESESNNLVLALESLSITSSSTDSLNPSSRTQSGMVEDGLQSSFAALDGFQVKDLYDHFEINISDLEMRLMKNHPFQELPLMEKSSVLVKLASCIIPEETILKQLEVEATLSLLNIHFSPSIFEGVMSVIEYLDIQDHGAQNASPHPTSIFRFSINTNLALFRLHVNLENEGDNSTVLILSTQQLDLWYSLAKSEEWSVRVKALELIACSSKEAADGKILCSSGNLLKSSSAHGQGMDAQSSDQNNNIDNGTTPEAVISLNCKVSRSGFFVSHKYTIYWRGAELHCYPYIIGLLTSFSDKITSYKISSADVNPSSLTADTSTPTEIPQFGFERFGFSNFIESGSCGCVPLDKYPFVTIYNSGSLGSLESSLCYSTSDWRKLFLVRNTKDRAEIGLNCKCNCCTLQRKCDCPLNELASSGGLGQISLVTVDVQVFNTNVHFHDSSSVFGTIILPVSRYLFTISDDHFDLVASAEDLMLESSLFTNYSGGFLWRNSLTDVSQVLNLRVRKRKLEPSRSELEVSIGIQHTCCILPPEYLAIIIGYFTLPDWTLKSGLQSCPQATELTEAHSELAITYKIEILDSLLVLPVENDDRWQLKADIQQLYISFIAECDLSNLVQHVPQECMIPLNQVAGRTDCLNIFGRDLSLSLLLSENGISTFKDDVCRSIALTASITADLWIRLPCDNNSLSDCIMSRVEVCEIVADDSDVLEGFKEFLDVIDQLSLVVDESKLFVSDVPQFRHTKMRLKQELAVAPLESSTSFIKLKFVVNLLTTKLHRLRKDSGMLLSEPVLQADMKFLCAGELKNNFPMSLDLQVFEIGLYSLLSSVLLARCTNAYGDPSALKVIFTEQSENKYDLCISLPSLDIWVHSSDWVEAIELLKSYSQKLEDSSQEPFLSNGSNLDMHDSTEVVRNICDKSDQVSDVLQSDLGVSENSCEVMAFSARSEIIGVTVNFPLCISHTEFPGFMETDVHERSEEEHIKTFKGKYCKYVSVTAFSRSGELSILGRDAKLSYKIEKLNGILAISGVGTVRSCSLFGASQLLVETSIQMNEKEIMSIDAGIVSDNVEMHASHQVLSFWHGVTFDAPETTSSQNSLGNMSVKVEIRDVSLLISDGKWGCSGLLFEVLMRNFLLQANLTEKNLESLVTCDLEVNYNNMHKVLWEPFIEPWNFDIKLSRKFEANALLNNAGFTEVIVASSNQLNVNLTESLFECIFRIIEMSNTWELMETDAGPDDKGLSFYCTRNTNRERYSPYVLQNLTSLPLGYQVFRGRDSDVLNTSAPVAQNFVQPGSSVPIYLDNSDTLLIPDRRRSHFGYFSSESGDATHHYMKVQLDGTSFASPPHSMDRIGLSYFEVDFSKTSSNPNNNVENASKSGSGSSFVVPVVYEVSLQQQSKLIRVYSTVIILNSTSMPLELRFDIPFGVSPKILDPIFPGQEFPLPLHLAKSGRLRWRPLGDSYLWSEAHSISKVLSQDSSRIGFRRSFACYPCHPSHEPFRCCISVQSTSLPPSFSLNDLPDGNLGRRLQDFDQSRERFIHQVTLSTPFVVSNCLPEPISLSIESGGITQAASLSEGENPFHHIDPSHDLVLEFKLNGSRPSSLKFPRSETFSTVAKFSGGKFSQIETVSFDSDLGGSVYVSCEKTMDVTCGAREVFISVPFLLYNCTGTPLKVSDGTNETKGIYSVIPSCYNLIEQHFVQGQKVGLGILTSERDLSDKVSIADVPSSPSSSECSNTVSSTDRFLDKHVAPSTRQVPFAACPKDSAPVRKRSLSSKSFREVCFQGNEPGKVKACIYSPSPISKASDTMIRVKRDLPGSDNSNNPYSLWSAPFPLVPPSGSTNVVVPQPSPGESSLLSVTCSILGGALAGRTQAITFQPRYIICNSCSKNLCYKQKGTNLVSHLAVGQHSQLQWTDTTRELLVSIRVSEPGWQWSGSFLPDHLGDTQLKIWNYVNKAFNMVRVEVQNASMSNGDEKIVGSVHGNVGTNFILLSDDDMGYMPYRIDNFSNERLRVYQQKCETFDTIVHPYTSCPYAWDEPCNPHRLTIEVPGDRVIGSYEFEITKQPILVHLRSTSEKPERTLLLSVSAEGATKVFSVVDSGYHTMKDLKETFDSKIYGKGKQKLQTDNTIRYTEKFLLVLPSIGISLINSHPQELVYACASNVVLDLNQSVDQQKLSFQISSLQIDNPLHNSTYPVILSFNVDHRSNPPDWGYKDNKARFLSETVEQIRSNSRDAVLYIGLSKWRKKDVSLVSFEYINIRIGEFVLELELQTLLSLLEFVKAVLPNSQARLLPLSDPTLHPLIYDTGSKDISSEDAPPHARNVPVFNKSHSNIVSLPIVVPIGAPWQHIHLLARRHRKIYVETFDLAPIKFTLSFCSAPWMLRNGILTSGESLIHRGLALADVEGARIHLKQLTIAHHMTSWESFQEILVGHYTRQILHEMYKVFGSAGVIGNPLGFARNVALGIKDFLSAPGRSVSKSPAGIIQGMAHGTTSLFSSTVYALSDAATQFSKAAHKGIVAFTFNDHDVARMEKQQLGEGSRSKGVIGEVFEGLTGLLQSPIRGAEKHGLPGVISGVAMGITGLVARPTASILEVTGKTAQSIRNRSRLHNIRSQRHRLRLPRPLSREKPLRPYSWEEAVGTSVLMEVGDTLKFKGETLVKCKALKQEGSFVVITGRLVLVVSSPSLVDLRKPGFLGVPIDLVWNIEREIGLESVIHTDSSVGGVVRIIGSNSDGVWNWRQNQQKKSSPTRKRWNNPSAQPLLQTNLELPSEEEAQELLSVLLSTIESGKSRSWHSRFVLSRSNIS